MGIAGRAFPGGRVLVRRDGALSRAAGRERNVGSALVQPGPTTTSGYHQVMRRSGAVRTDSAKTVGAESGLSSTAGAVAPCPDGPDDPGPPLPPPPAPTPAIGPPLPGVKGV